MYNDKITTEMKVGERHPVLLNIGRAVVFGGAFTMLLILLATALTVHATSVQEYKNAHSFQPVHLQAVLQSH